MEHARRRQIRDSVLSELTLWVPGIPYPQGSLIYKGQRRGKPVMVHGDGVYAWRGRIQAAWMVHPLRRGWQPIDAPVIFSATFTMPRPARPMFNVPATAPDVDKLVRATFDGLGDAQVVKNDARVYGLREVFEQYEDADHPTGAVISLYW